MQESSYDLMINFMNLSLYYHLLAPITFLHSAQVCTLRVSGELQLQQQQSSFP